MLEFKRKKEGNLEEKRGATDNRVRKYEVQIRTAIVLHFQGPMPLPSISRPSIGGPW
jgi:hypothetical protein